jgi:site-specific DNA recombinase
MGDVVYSMGALYTPLRKQIYLKELEGRGQVYAGENKAIVPPRLWEQFQAQKRANDQVHQYCSRAAVPSPLAGLLYVEHGNGFAPAHAVKNGNRYRYYVSQAAIKNPDRCHEGPVRIPAGEIEKLICSKLSSFPGSSRDVIEALALQTEKGTAVHSILKTARPWSKRLRPESGRETFSFIRTVIGRITAYSEKLDLSPQAGSARRPNG